MFWWIPTYPFLPGLRIHVFYHVIRFPTKTRVAQTITTFFFANSLRSESIRDTHLYVGTHVCVVQERENVQFVHAHGALERIDESAPGHVHVCHHGEFGFRDMSLVGPLHVDHRYSLQGQFFRYEHARFHRGARVGKTSSNCISYFQNFLYTIILFNIITHSTGTIQLHYSSIFYVCIATTVCGNEYSHKNKI